MTQQIILKRFEKKVNGEQWTADGERRARTNMGILKRLVLRTANHTAPNGGGDHYPFIIGGRDP